jgi:hypothetical protein
VTKNDITAGALVNDDVAINICGHKKCITYAAEDLSWSPQKCILNAAQNIFTG